MAKQMKYAIKQLNILVSRSGFAKPSHVRGDMALMNSRKVMKSILKCHEVGGQIS